jgi:hydrophobic/amphiphilic exporter-1 (mainly G- bacteria), HAE1 family
LPLAIVLIVPMSVLSALTGVMLRGMDNNILTQIGLVVLVGLAAKNAILIVEFARLEYEKGRPLIDAALTGARTRLRPILMTSFAFILGTVPLGIATGSGAVARRIIGTVVIGGMLAATCIAVCLIPVTFYVVERLARSRREAKAETKAAPGGEAPTAGTV